MGPARTVPATTKPTTGTLPHTPASIAAAARSLGVTDQVASAAAAHLTARTATLLVVSGNLGSGKDTVAPAVINALGISDAVHLYYALPLKDEVNDMIADLRTWWFSRSYPALTPARRKEVAALLADRHHMPLEKVRFYTGRMLDQVIGDLSVHSRARTSVIREVLQFHGTECRRAQDEKVVLGAAARNAVSPT